MMPPPTPKSPLIVPASSPIIMLNMYVITNTRIFCRYKKGEGANSTQKAALPHLKRIYSI